MAHATTRLLFDRLIAPRVLLLGIGFSFLTCCAAGLVAGRHYTYSNFGRFHPFVAPQTQFYPTACQVRALARSRLDPDKIAVIVGGTSILYGSYQPLPELWSTKLQALLGDRYQVLNLGLGGARTTEFGATAAEILAADYKKLILVTDLAPGCLHPEPDGLSFKYFYWDAYYKGLLLPHPARDKRLRELPPADASPAAHVPSENSASNELRRGMRLDSLLSFNDLWNMAAYTTFFSVWTPRTRDDFTRPRRLYDDPEQAPPPDHVHYLHDRGESVRGAVAMYRTFPTEAWATFERSAATCFPEAVRPRTLMLVMWNDPAYLSCLSADEQAGYAEVSRSSTRHLEGLGFATLEVGKAYQAEDYADFCHLVPSGAAKLAAEVAPKVRVLAERLGYTKEGSVP